MSEKQSFILQKLTLRKSPGLPRGLKSLEDLSPNINIVYGPNGSGKSSTVRAIQQLIWQQNKRGVELKASASIDDNTWIFHIDHQPTLTQKNGIDAQLTDVPAQEMKNHYALSINDLFIHDDAELAGEIRKQASGGYDLEEAKKALAYKSNINTTAIKEYKEYEAARKAVNSIQNEQRQVKTRERSLETLRMEEREAKKARSKVDFLEKMVNYLKKSQEVQQHETELNQYQEIYELLRGDELERIEELEKSIRDNQVQVNSIEQKIEEQENNLEQLDIPAEGIPRKVLDELEQRLNHLQSLEREANDLEVDIAELEESNNERLKAIDPGIDPALWKGFNIHSTDELDQILPDAYQTLAKRHNIEVKLQQLEEEIQDSDAPGVDLDQLNKALHALAEWLKVESVDRKYSTWSVVLLGLIIIFLGIIISGSAEPPQYVPYILILTSVVIFASYFYLNINSKIINSKSGKMILNQPE